MELFRAKKRDTELASLGDQPTNLKKHRTGSVDNLLETMSRHCDEDEEEDVFTAESTASESESEDVGKVSKMQKIFAKRSIKREKRKEKEHKKKVEKNHISMDDFLSKQSEFKMWLHEEKSKNAGGLSSPKLKSLFKQFVQAWNKRKLPPKYFKSSEASPLTQKKQTFMLADGSSSEPLHCELEVDNDRDNPSSPFVTFGKTPPKVFKSKRLQIFGNKPDIALISVAAIGSPHLPKKISNKENVSTAEEQCQYQTPAKQIVGPATPYKVSVFPWALADDSGNQSLEICSTSTPPNTSGFQEKDEWPPPPTEEEINGSSKRTNTASASTKDSPHVPPPPPPRSESLTPGIKYHLHSPVVPDGYADPYDKLSSTSRLPTKPFSDYQEPVDTVIRINTRTQPENPRPVLRSFSQNDEPDTSLYSKPIHNEDLSHLRFVSNGSNSLDSSNGKVPDVVLCSQPAKNVNPRSDDIEELYAKPMKKKLKQVDSDDPKIVGSLDHIDPSANSSGTELNKSKIIPTSESFQDKEEIESELYSEVMAHYQMKATELKIKSTRRPDPIYESIDECQEKLYAETEPKPEFGIAHVQAQTKFEGPSQLSKMKKKTVLAASSDKIYETYLSLKGNPNLLKEKPQKDKNGPCYMNTLNKKFKSQPDISFSENSLKEFDSVGKLGLDNENMNKDSTEGANYVHLTVAQRAASMEHGLKEPVCPDTPIITATPSFDSLCAVTPLSKMSGSSQSLPMITGSFESLTSETSVSISSRSTLSTVPDEDESRLLENIEDESIPTVQPDGTNVGNKIFPENGNTSLDDNAIKEKFECGNIPITPGKISAAKHGIDLSVYILKPTKQEENRPGEKNHLDNASANEVSKGIGKVADCNVKNTIDSSISQKLFDTQARLAIKDTFSSGKNRTDIAKSGGKKEIDRRHLEQTAHGLNASSPQKSTVHSAVPSIGVASKTHKAECSGKSGKSRPRQQGQSDAAESAVEPDSKRLCVGTKVMGHGKDLYLETDIDRVIVDKGRTNLKKSKSHSSVDQSSSTVMTEIW